MTEKTDSVAMKEAIEEIEKMINNYKKPKPKSPEEKEEDRSLSALIEDHARGLMALGMEKALEVLKKRVI